MTTLPEEAVKAAQKAYRECEGDSTESHRAALTAALPFLPVQGAVKKLKWNEYNDEQGIPDRWDAEASSFGVFYSIEIQHDGYRVVFDHEAVGAVGVFDTLETAKAAAQADYSARILSALEPSAARELALEEAARVCDAKIVSMQAHYDQTDNPFIRSNLAGDIALISHLAAAIRALSSPDHADAGKVEGDGWRPIESAPTNRAIQIFIPNADYYGNDGVYAGILVDLGTGQRWATFGWAVARDLPPHMHPSHWRPLPSAPSEGAE